MIEEISKEELVVRTTRTKYIRVGRDRITLSDEVCRLMGLEEGGSACFNKESHDSVMENIYISKREDRERGFRLYACREGLVIYSVGLSKLLTGHFGRDDERKSIRLDIKPEPVNDRSKHGFDLYELVRI